jgi:hypothetical protein
MFQTERQQAETRRWVILATHLNGAVDSGEYQHITTAAILRELQGGDIFAFLGRELGTDVDLSELTDVDRHELLTHWRIFATGYEPYQFHVRHNGLALLIGYLLHLIQIRHAKIPT